MSKLGAQVSPWLFPAAMSVFEGNSLFLNKNTKGTPPMFGPHPHLSIAFPPKQQQGETQVDPNEPGGSTRPTARAREDLPPGGRTPSAPPRPRPGAAASSASGGSTAPASSPSKTLSAETFFGRQTTEKTENPSRLLGVPEVLEGTKIPTKDRRTPTHGGCPKK